MHHGLFLLGPPAVMYVLSQLHIVIVWVCHFGELTILSDDFGIHCRIGYATRVCNASGAWDAPDTTDCENPALTVLASMVRVYV